MNPPPVRCPYHRRHDPGDGSDAFGCCTLAGEVFGVGEPELIRVSPEACEACQSLFPPSPSNPNYVAASVVHVVGERILERGGVDGCGEDEARNVMGWAAAFLPVLSLAPDMASTPLEAYDGPCFYLGEQVGERECRQCRGSVRQKVFACQHERHGETIIEECRQCPDYDRSLAAGGVATWAVGVVAAPRAEATLERSLRSLVAAGWEEGILFAEPRTPKPDPLPASFLWVERALPLGAWANWLLALEELTLRYPRADAFLICQDDVLYCRGLRRYLEEALWPGSPVGVVSLHAASHQDAGSVMGFYGVDFGWQAWGAQAYVFPNPAARAFLRHPMVRNHRHRGPGQGVQNIDSVTGQWCRDSGLPYVLHTPSLTQHVGEASAIWDGGGVLGRRRAGTFPGEDSDIRDVMRDASGSTDRMTEPGPIERPREPGRPAGPDQAVRPTGLWEQASMVIVSPLIGRLGPFDRWRDWLLSAELPPAVEIRLVDNSRGDDIAFTRRLAEAVEGLRASGRYRRVAVARGPGPADTRDGRRFTLAKHESVAAGYNAGLEGAEADLALILDCDVIPPPDGLRRLVDLMDELRSRGERVGAVSGCCESAAARGQLAACRSFVDWHKRIGVDELGEDAVLEVGFVGTAFLLVDHRLLREMMPIRAQHVSRMTGPDGYVCQELRRRGHGVWLHGGVRCEHLIDA